MKDTTPDSGTTSDSEHIADSEHPDNTEYPANSNITEHTEETEDSLHTDETTAAGGTATEIPDGGADGRAVRSGTRRAGQSMRQHSDIESYDLREPHEDYAQQPSANQTLSFDYLMQSFAASQVAWTPGVLDALPLRVNKLFTNTALLISDQNPATLTCVAYGDAHDSTSGEQIHLHGSIFKQFNEALAFLNVHNPHERWPLVALREALINAVEHRDYSYTGPTIINVFATRIEVISLGGLVQDLQINDLLNGVCQPRNVVLVGLFEKLHLSGNCGSGIRRIMNSYETSAISPQLRVAPSSVAMILPLPVKSSHPWSDGHHHEPSSSSANGEKPQESPDQTARRYTFPMEHPYSTDDTALALAGMRVIGTTPIQIAVLGQEQAGWQIGANGVPVAHASMSAQIQPLVTLEEFTLHFIAEAGVPLSRAQIQDTLGRNKNQTAHLLHTLNQQGKINVQGRSRATRYSL